MVPAHGPCTVILSVPSSTHTGARPEGHFSKPLWGLVSGSVRSGSLKTTGASSVMRDRTTALITTRRWPAVFNQTFGKEGTQNLQGGSGLCIWKKSRCWSVRQSDLLPKPRPDSLPCISSFSVKSCRFQRVSLEPCTLLSYRSITESRTGENFYLSLYFIPKFFSSWSMLTS